MFFWASGCLAETLSDPTRPPPGATVSGGGAEPQEAVSAAQVLQSVTLSRQRKVATISGQEVALGGKLGDATLIAIHDSDVTLRNADGTLETLRMYPQIEKKVIQQKELSPVKKSTTRTKIKE